MDWFQAQKQLSDLLSPKYGDREAAVIADWVMEALSGKKRSARLMIREEVLPDPAVLLYERYQDELLAGRPVQYVLGESWFAGMRFFVDERVLIPRPETEELVDWVVAVCSGDAGAVLDVGTGSGCIAVTLAKRLPLATVFACDVSPGALAVAGGNARELGGNVAFLESDFLRREGWPGLPPVRWLVSNPPYIPVGERLTMAAHVIDYEPNTALFVPDNDPLVFYRALGEFAGQRLEPGGALFAEIHEEHGPAVAALMRELGAREVELCRDLQGKDRMVRAAW